ncbi:MAG: hypothetical protein CMA09_03030 [Euryarchaeota archaeon]|nr:hypothetical protein [Euryarchaeota archaeon]
MEYLNILVKNSAEVIEYNYAKRWMIPMAAKAPKGTKPRKKKKRRMRLSLKQKKINVKTDKYTDSLGWSQDVGRTLGDAPSGPAQPETLKIQCDMCGCMLKIPKPKKARYTVSCAYPGCDHIMKFD